MGDLFDADDAVGVSHAGTGLMGGGLPAIHQEATVVIKAPVGTTLDSIPSPQPPAGDGELTEAEEATFEACKAGMNNLHNAFWIAGKALETMKTGELHRKSGIPNFADFVWANWEVSESQAQRLMGEWRMGEALAALGWSPRESQVRELVDIAKQSGPKAAVSVYDAVARTGQRVTARALKQVVQRLPRYPVTPLLAMSARSSGRSSRARARGARPREASTPQLGSPRPRTVPAATGQLSLRTSGGSRMGSPMSETQRRASTGRPCSVL
ncbi:hypothetical protein SANT12839_101610 [Streptomyces antimycoticus]|uniref:Uncharacterized protein n=1 Tax=Streptomyces antimycoticus TaxID=68175 RepID=A0A4D4KTU3_9ACTN|nr:hypothetical protein [Streptomyces antimycoticus]GDY49279.1 hypothetical protein SANT12839_101610 [Streptomyces antimycoticus]